jgi:hypothetical protein
MVTKITLGEFKNKRRAIYIFIILVLNSNSGILF